MKKCAFISRHNFHQNQFDMAAERGYELVKVDDCDAFNAENLIHAANGFDAVAVVHPAAALTLIATHDVLIFQTLNRAPVGQPPQFECAGVHVFARR